MNIVVFRSGRCKPEASFNAVSVVQVLMGTHRILPAGGYRKEEQGNNNDSTNGVSRILGVGI